MTALLFTLAFAYPGGPFAPAVAITDWATNRVKIDGRNMCCMTRFVGEDSELKCRPMYNSQCLRMVMLDHQQPARSIYGENFTAHNWECVVVNEKNVVIKKGFKRCSQADEWMHKEAQR